MTESQIVQAQNNAIEDAAELGLLLLLAFENRSGANNVTFDPGTGVFRINGKKVSARSIISYLEKIDKRMARRLVKITRDLEAGKITLDEWKRNFDRTITSTHILLGAFAVGGIFAASRTPVLLDNLNLQYAYADRFAGEVRDGRAGSFAKIRARIRSYVQAAHITYSQLELEMVKHHGVRKEALNILRPAEHCFSTNDTIGCPELTRQGWMDIEKMVPIGMRTCTIWCKCRVIYR